MSFDGQQVERQPGVGLVDGDRHAGGHQHGGQTARLGGQNGVIQAVLGMQVLSFFMAAEADEHPDIDLLLNRRLIVEFHLTGEGMRIRNPQCEQDVHIREEKNPVACQLRRLFLEDEDGCGSLIGKLVASKNTGKPG